MKLQNAGLYYYFESKEEAVLLCAEKFAKKQNCETTEIEPLVYMGISAVVNKALNDGACFTDYDGNIVNEVPQLTGAYIDETRGALKVTDIISEEYPPVLSIFDSGVYHLYDYQFFYRNLQKNVSDRVAKYIEINN